jgi:hypothetical protein
MGEDDKKSDSRIDDGSVVVPKADKLVEVYPKGVELVVIIIALCLAELLVALDQTIIATAIPRITDRFNSVQDIGWYGSVSSTNVLFEKEKKRPLTRRIF